MSTEKVLPTDESTLHPAGAITDFQRGFEAGARGFRERAEAWHEVYDTILSHNPNFSTAQTGLESVLKEIRRLQRTETAAKRLLSLVEAKGQPRESAENRALIEAGDTIAVNEGNLWALQIAMQP